MNYNFTDKNGTFKIDNPEMSSYMYFPLCNDGGIKSAITPELGGDLKMDQNTFALMPVSSEELHSARSTRNFWVKTEAGDLWSLTGQSAAQQMLKTTDMKDETSLEAGLLYHKVTRTSKQLPLKSVVTTYVPSDNAPIEMTEFALTNTGDKALTVEATCAIPLYGRSADNYRDHRQVTSLLGRGQMTEAGFCLKPTLSFDERGHQVNDKVYGVTGTGYHGDGSAIQLIGVIPTVEAFIGEGGNQAWPLSLMNRDQAMMPLGTATDGYEILAGLCYEKVTIEAGATIYFYNGIYITEDKATPIVDRMKAWNQTYGNKAGFQAALEATKAYWQAKVDVVKLESGNTDFDQWMTWINLQPILRRIYGCSFLPHHDYGRGGRGWRDLWQDCLALLLMEPGDVRGMLLNNFAGVRIDGSNATIIGTEPGEFVADRNNIPRTWMDHGAWPWLTVKEYIHQSGDIDFLFEQQAYFKDALTARSTDRDDQWDDSYGNRVKTADGSVYTGSLLEHLILQNLSVFLNVGDHNILLLEGADWNDALDMADERGESVPFTALFASNLRDLADLLRDLKDKKGMTSIALAEEMLTLFEDIDESSVEAKKAQLQAYFTRVKHGITGVKKDVAIDELVQVLDKKVAWMKDHLQKQEFITSKEGFSWFNSYYDDNGRAVEGDHDLGCRMMLTGQVFTLMGDMASEDQSKAVVASAKHYLQDASVGGYRLNTNFHEIKHDLGRGFGFAYGHKENGAMFSHMAVMYANALYRRGFVAEGFEVLNDMFKHCNDFDKARIYPSVPEYINELGRGMYTYLTGSASWLLYTVVSQMYGCKGHYGDLLLAPQLHPSQFDSQGMAQITFLYQGQPLTIQYKLENPSAPSADQSIVYDVVKAEADTENIEITKAAGGAILPTEAVQHVQKRAGLIHVTLQHK